MFVICSASCTAYIKVVVFVVCSVNVYWHTLSCRVGVIASLLQAPLPRNVTLIRSPPVFAGRVMLRHVSSVANCVAFLLDIGQSA